MHPREVLREGRCLLVGDSVQVKQHCPLFCAAMAWGAPRAAVFIGCWEETVQGNRWRVYQQLLTYDYRMGSISSITATCLCSSQCFCYHGRGECCRKHAWFSSHDHGRGSDGKRSRRITLMVLRMQEQRLRVEPRSDLSGCTTRRYYEWPITPWRGELCVY